MSAYFKFLWEKLKSGQDFDIVLTIIAALIVGIFNALGFTGNQNLINSTILLVLFLLSISSLVSRHRVERLCQKIIIYSQRGTFERIHDSGLENYQPKRQHKDLIQIVEEAKRRLDFLGTSLPDMSSDQGWEALKRKVLRNKKIHVRILLLDPDCEMTQKKQKLEYFKSNWKNISDDIDRAIRTFKSIRTIAESEGSPVSINRYDVRLYDSIPTTSCVFNEKVLNISFYDENQPGSMTPAWTFRKERKLDNLYSYYHKNFDLLWKKSKSIFDKS